MSLHLWALMMLTLMRKKTSNTDNKLNDKKDPQPKADTSQWFRVEKLVKTKKLNDEKIRGNQKRIYRNMQSRDFTLTELNRIIDVITLVDDIKYVK